MKSTMISKLASKLTSNKRSKPSPTSSAVPNASDSVSAGDNDNERYAYSQFDNRSGFVQFFAAFWYSARREWDFLVQNRWDFSLMFWMPIVLIFLV